MPNRILRDGINSSPRVNALPPLAELFYRRLMTVVDDFGRFYASPATLRGACWPTCPEKVTEQNVAEWLRACSAGKKPLVLIYEVDGAKYLQIEGFGQPQRSKPRYPAPSEGVQFQPPAICAQPEINLHADCEQVESVPQPDREQPESGSRADGPQNDCSLRSSYFVFRSSKFGVRDADASPKNGSADTKGSRLTLAEIPEDWAQWSISEFGWDRSKCAAEFEEFADYWRGVAGAKGRKVDWFGTWRTRCRELARREPSAANGLASRQPGQPDRLAYLDDLPERGY
jgi:hypothetical protein